MLPHHVHLKWVKCQNERVKQDTSFKWFYSASSSRFWNKIVIGSSWMNIWMTFPPPAGYLVLQQSFLTVIPKVVKSNWFLSATDVIKSRKWMSRCYYVLLQIQSPVHEGLKRDTLRYRNWQTLLGSCEGKVNKSLIILTKFGTKFPGRFSFISIH